MRPCLRTNRIYLVPEDVSDEESAGDAIPFESSENGKKKDVKDDGKEASEDEDSDEEGEGMYVYDMRPWCATLETDGFRYVVEKIVGHEFKRDVRRPDPCANPAMDSSDLVSGIPLPLGQMERI